MSPFSWQLYLELGHFEEFYAAGMGMIQCGMIDGMITRVIRSTGSGVVTYYLRESGVIPYLEKLGFDIVGYGCMTCIGNSGKNKV